MPTTQLAITETTETVAISIASAGESVVIYATETTAEIGGGSGEVNTINSITTGEPVGSDVVLNVVSLTQAEYDAGTPVATTFYIITG